MSSSSGTVLHQYRTKVLWYLVPVFFVLGCLILAMAVGFPLLWKPTGTGVIVSIAIAVAVGILLPIVSILIVLLVPSITTLVQPDRGIIELVYKRPLWTSRKEFLFADIADIRPILIGDEALSLALILKNKSTIRIDYSSTTDREDLYRTVTEIKAKLMPYLQLPPIPAARE